MANNLQVTEGADGKYVRTVEVTTNDHLPLHALLLQDDGAGARGEVERNGTDLKTAIEQWNAGVLSVDATGQGDVPITLSGEAVTLAANDGTDIGDVDVASQPARSAATDSIESIPSSDHVIAGGSEVAIQTAFIDVSSSGESTLVTAVTSTKIRVLSLTITTDTAHKVSFLDGSAGSVLHAVYAAANGGATETGQGFLFETSAGNGLIANLGGANNTAIRCTYCEV